MSDREELESLRKLRRLAELEAKASPQSAKSIPLSDPTSTLPIGGKFLTGLGTAGTELSQGVRQLLNIGDQDALQKEIALSRKIDAPFKSGFAGMTGNIVGKAAPLVGLGLVPPIAGALGVPAFIGGLLPGAATVAGGAGAGLLSGMLEPSLDNNEAARNAMFGAGGGAAGVLAGRLIPSFGKALLDPFRAGGREQIVGKTLQRFAGDKIDDVTKAAAQATAKTPGWNPTLSEATMNPGLAVLERGAVSADPALSAALATRGIEQNAAALSAIRQIAGTPAQRLILEESRKNAAGPLYARAMEEGVDEQVAKALQPQIKNLMERPSMQTAAARAKEIFGEESIALAKSGDSKGLQYLKQALDDIVQKASSPTSSIGKNQLRALTQTRDDLRLVLDELVPTLRQADQIYAGMSMPVNQSRIAAELEKKLTPALMDFSPNMPANVTPSRYAEAMRSLEEKLPSLTGYPGATLQGSISNRAMDTLTGIGEDMARRSIVSKLAGGPNSQTAQNLATQNLMRQIFGPLGLPESFSEATIAKTLMGPLNLITKQAAEPEIKAVMARVLTDPEFASMLMAQSYKPNMLTQQYYRSLPLMGSGGGLLAAKRNPEE